jgi:hypothetical protein
VSRQRGFCGAVFDLTDSFDSFDKTQDKFARILFWALPSPFFKWLFREKPQFVLDASICGQFCGFVNRPSGSAPLKPTKID